MFHRYNITLVFAVFCAGGLFYLGNLPSDAGSGDSLLTSEDSKTSSKVEVPGKSDEMASDEASGEPDLAEADAPVAVVFEPPYPDRSNLFQAPKRQGRSSGKAFGQNESNVELLGFVNVDGQRAAISINGLVTTVAEGDQQFGIEIISIQPPAIVLQRGRQRWQATLDN